MTKLEKGVLLTLAWILFVLGTILTVTKLWGQTDAPEPVFTVKSSPERGPQVVIYAGSDGVLMRAWDAQGDLTFTVYQDGHVAVTKGQSLDKVSRDFWKTFARGYRTERSGK